MFLSSLAFGAEGLVGGILEARRGWALLRRITSEMAAVSNAQTLRWKFSRCCDAE